MENNFQEAVATEKLFDLGYIQQMCRGNREVIHKIIALFIQMIPGSMEMIKLGLQTGDFDTVKKTFHRIKPVLLNYSILNAKETLHAIEILDNESWFENFPMLKVAEMEANLKTVVAELKLIIR